MPFLGGLECIRCRGKQGGGVTRGRQGKNSWTPPRPSARARAYAPFVVSVLEVTPPFCIHPLNNTQPAVTELQTAKKLAVCYWPLAQKAPRCRIFKTQREAQPCLLRQIEFITSFYRPGRSKDRALFTLEQRTLVGVAFSPSRALPLALFTPRAWRMVAM